MEDAIPDEDKLSDVEAEESDAVEYWSRFEPNDDPDWFEDLLNEAPYLIIDFFAAAKGHPDNFTREGFDKRFSWALGKLNLRAIPMKASDVLFSRASEQRQQLAAYDSLKRETQGKEFAQIVEFLIWKRKSLSAILGLLKSGKPLVPERVSLWEGFWAERLERIAETNLAQATSSLVQMRDIYRLANKFGRTNLESYLLDLALPDVEAIRKELPGRVGSYALLVAYGHASQLVVLNGLENDGEPIEAMKNRIARVRHADKSKKVAVLSLFLAQMVKGATNSAKTTNSAGFRFTQDKDT